MLNMKTLLDFFKSWFKKKEKKKSVPPRELTSDCVRLLKIELDTILLSKQTPYNHKSIKVQRYRINKAYAMVYNAYFAKINNAESLMVKEIFAIMDEQPDWSLTKMVTHLEATGKLVYARETVNRQMAIIKKFKVAMDEERRRYNNL